jgi:hypothetical protein
VGEDPADDDVIQSLLGVQAEPVGDLFDALGAEVAFGIHVYHLSLAPAHLERELARHAEGVGQLRLACAELPEKLGDGAGLDTTAEDVVQGVGAGGDLTVSG